MRQDGKTTRLVDLAIQELFRTGKIIVPTSHGIERIYRGNMGYSEAYIAEISRMIDPDHEAGNRAQLDFITVLRNRLMLEHRGSYSLEETSIKLVFTQNT